MSARPVPLLSELLRPSLGIRFRASGQKSDGWIRYDRIELVPDEPSRKYFAALEAEKKR